MGIDGGSSANCGTRNKLCVLWHFLIRPLYDLAKRTSLERAVDQEPGNADCWAMLAMLVGEEHRFGFNVKPDSLGRSLKAARRAVEIAHANHFAWLAFRVDMPKGGLEPPRVASHAPQTCASASSATSA